MPRFRYQRGEKPLDGFTIEHGLGVGGFGEVYYAVSDAGREVALKAVQNYEEIELRGIRQCMNLKSPHLVTVFDVKHDERGQPFVIMEYVQGPSLRQLLDNAPAGLGSTKAAFFLREIAKGLTYLHDAGVVHRDLKPHNVFYEEGFVKIGDYSLCKMMSTSHRTGHTMTVGTVHYMAPEISEGRYDASVDIYALGIMVYEMLTGTPPFVGDSIGEVLMKSMTAEANLSVVDEPFRSAIAKAIAKDPEQRFSCAAEFVEAVFGVQHVQNSVVEFNPQELTMVAHQAAKRVLATPSGRSSDSSRPVDQRTGHWQPSEKKFDRNIYVAAPASPVSGGDTNKTSADYTAAVPPLPPQKERTFQSEPILDSALAPDVIHPIIRYGLAAVSCLLVSAAIYFLAPQGVISQTGMLAGFNIVIMAIALSAAQRLFLRTVPFESQVTGRLVIAGCFLGLIVLRVLQLPHLGLVCLAAPFLILNWHQLMHARRRCRLTLWPVLATSFMTYIFFAVWTSWYGGIFYGGGFEFSALYCAAVAAGTGLCLQIASPMQLPKNTTAKAPDAPLEHHRQPTSAAKVGQAARNPATAAATYQSAPSSTTAQQSGFAVLKSLLVVPGILLYAVSSILAVLEISSVVEGVDFFDHDVVRILATVGFGLLVASIGFMIASGTRKEWAFLRLIAAVGILAMMHYSCLSGRLSMSPMYLLASIVLFAWPANSQRSTAG